MNDIDNIKDIDQALLNLATSYELWVAIGAVLFLFASLYIKKIVTARTSRTFGKQRFLAQSDVCKGSVYWFGTATGSDPWVLIEVTTDYIRLEDKDRVKFIPTRSFPTMEWTQSKALSSQAVLGTGIKRIDVSD